MQPLSVVQELNGYLDSLAELMHKKADGDSEGRGWQKCYLDERTSGDTGDCRLVKFRVILDGGIELSELDPPRGTAHLSREIFELRDRALVGKDKWYGLVITVFPDRRCEVQFNYDPDCVSDKSFFDT